MKQKISIAIFVVFSFVCVSTHAQGRIGIIGLDTSHAPAFVKSMNTENPKPEYVGFQVVAAYPYGSKAIKSSFDRIPKFTEDVVKYGVKISSSIEELLSEVDYVMLETNDGNMHLEQVAKVFQAGKPVFIDKPIGANLAQAIAIFELAERYNVPVFSSSALRYSAQNQKLRDGELGKVFGIDAYTPGILDTSHADFAWYGIHGIETLYTVLRTGCISVQRTHTIGSDFVVGKWCDGRIGTVRGVRDGKPHVYGGSAFTEKGVEQAGGYQGYDVLLIEIASFFRTKIAPITKEETLEIFAFIEAADLSKKKGGKAIMLKDVMKQGQKDAKKLIKKLKF